MSQAPLVALDQIKVDLSAITSRITSLEALLKSTTVSFRIPAAEILRRPGEHYAGRMHSDEPDREPSYDLMVTAIRLTRLNFQDNLAWAKEHGDAPSRKECALIYAHLRDLLKDSECVFWTGEEHAERSGCAWYQSFRDGYQGWRYQGLTCFGLSVRRLIV